MTIADTPPTGSEPQPEDARDVVAAAAAARPDRRALARIDGSDRRHTSRGEDDLAWLRIVLGTGSGGTTELLARPSLDELHLLVPTSPPAAAAAALRRFDDDRTLVAIASGFGGRALARLGLLGLVPGKRITLPRFELVDELARALGEPALVASVTIGTRRRNRKPVLQLLTPAGRVVGYAKVAWSPLSRQLVANEADVLSLVEGRLPEWLQVPVVLHRQDWRGGEVVVTSPLVPASRLVGMLSTARALRSGREARPASAARLLAATVDAIAAACPGTAGPVGELALFAEWEEGGLGSVVDLRALRTRHRAAVVTTGLWHGDLTPWNLSARGASVTLWDWEFAGPGRPVGFDALHHEFERHRRRPNGSNDAALTATIAGAAETLITTDRVAVDAVVDLYLCELIARELRLDGQRWKGGAVAGLGEVALATLAQRQPR